MLPSVLYSHDIFSTQFVGGISRYIYELHTHNQNSSICALYSENLYLHKHRQTPTFRGKRRLISTINEGFERLILAYKHFDIYHPSYYKTITKPKNTMLVTTIHDMIHEIYAGRFFPHNSKDSRLKRYLCEKSDLLLAISHQTKYDLIKIFGIDERKIQVIYHGYSLQKILKPLKLPKHYILFVGQREGYKNFINFARAFALLHKNYPYMYAVCVGKPFTPQERGFLESLGMQKQFFCIQAQEDELYTLYHQALCFVFPSLYEGFGIPILESFYAQCPALLSDIAVFREIAKDCVLFFDPNSPHSMANTIESVIVNPQLTRKLIAKATTHLQNFSWDMTAQQTLWAYKQLLGGGAAHRVRIYIYRSTHAHFSLPYIQSYLAQGDCYVA